MEDKGRSITYNNIIRTLKSLSFKVENIDQLRNIEGFGDKTLKKIKEILEKESLDRLKFFQQNERLSIMQKLTEVHGIGNEMAFKLYKKGIKTIKDLQNYAKTNPEEFTFTQPTAIELHLDIFQKIPRKEVKILSSILINEAKIIDSESKSEICGSFRRKRDLCGDVDIVISTKVENFLLFLVKNSEIITHTFSLSSSKFIGIGKVGQVHRRIDIYVCKPSEH